MFLSNLLDVSLDIINLTTVLFIENLINLAFLAPSQAITHFLEVQFIQPVHFRGGSSEDGEDPIRLGVIAYSHLRAILIVLEGSQIFNATLDEASESKVIVEVQRVDHFLHQLLLLFTQSRLGTFVVKGQGVLLDLALRSARSIIRRGWNHRKAFGLIQRTTQLKVC